MPHQTPIKNPVRSEDKTKQGTGIVSNDSMLLHDHTSLAAPLNLNSVQEKARNTKFHSIKENQSSGNGIILKYLYRKGADLKSPPREQMIAHSQNRGERSSLYAALFHKNIFPSSEARIANQPKLTQRLSHENAQTTEISTQKRSIDEVSSTQLRNEQAEEQILKILDIHTELCEMPCLKPCTKINNLFGTLVGICVQTLPRTVTEKIMTDSRILEILPSIRAIASEAESLLELHWASLVTSSSSKASLPTPPATPSDSESFSLQDKPIEDNARSSPPSSYFLYPTTDCADEIFSHLQTFPYYQNYVDLARMELSALLPLVPNNEAIEKIAFIGSGPLPLTSLCISHLLVEMQPLTYHEAQGKSHQMSDDQEHNSKPSKPRTLEILNVDSDQTAIAQSSTLCTLLGRHAQGMTFACERAGASTRDLTPFDVVFLAALVGSTQEAKEAILLQVIERMRAGSLVVVRTSHGLRRVLYPEFDFATEAVLEAMQILTVVHPYSHVVNSIIVGRVR